MTDDRKTLLAIEAGQRLLERAQRAKDDGQIKGFVVCVLERDPRIIDHITLIR